jgi:hypothetical protein
VHFVEAIPKNPVSDRFWFVWMFANW